MSTCITVKATTISRSRLATQGYHSHFSKQCVSQKGFSSVKCVGAGLYGSSAAVLPTTTCTNPRLARSRHTDTGRRTAVHIVAGNEGSTGPFAPIVRITRDIVGTKEFNKLRGKAISLHSQVIKDFCKQIGVDTKQVQGLIRLAKKNGEKLGFLA
eukprot:jgi/Picre1/27880/NNA_000843.t1